MHPHANQRAICCFLLDLWKWAAQSVSVENITVTHAHTQTDASLSFSSLRLSEPFDLYEGEHVKWKEHLKQCVHAVMPLDQGGSHLKPICLLKNLMSDCLAFSWFHVKNYLAVKLSLFLHTPILRATVVNLHLVFLPVRFEAFLSLCLFLFMSLCRLPVQTVSHEPLLGPEAILESSKAWREHWRGAPQQAACKQSDHTCTSLPSVENMDLSLLAPIIKTKKGRSYARLVVDSGQNECKASQWTYIYRNFTLRDMYIFCGKTLTSFYRHFRSLHSYCCTFMPSTPSFISSAALQYDLKLSDHQKIVICPAFPWRFLLKLFKLLTSYLRSFLMRFFFFFLPSSMQLTWRRSRMTLKTKSCLEQWFSMGMSFRFVTAMLLSSVYHSDTRTFPNTVQIINN